ncbi:HlyD family efflux transporter periplasmic adaptor subunit [Limnobacter humi]|uniref:HlyD family efflux transporter periplasmic adaptor subunit n=1 Tax=Limnobacter humi TaxID=1778671 RepID=A0ABT1WEV3_9BURK|nr:HlyD family efflux transporter periplasmic adaptor subunit [Limnobacter humi]MCQ8894954.1 HlyD family efflux transporter periplasmic adaptor subunit [Limnobacter humi]
MSTTQTPINAGKRKKVIAIFLSAVVLGGLGFAAYEYAFGRFSEETDNAYVAGDLVVVSSQVTGNVKRVLADDNQVVTAGQALIELDNTDTQVALAQAEAQLADTVRAVKSLYDQVNINKAGAQSRQADIAKATEDVNRLTAENTRAQSDLNRREAAFKLGAVSAEELEHARSTATQMAAQLSAAKAALLQAQAGLTQAQATLDASLNQTRDVKVSSHPRVLQAAAQLRAAFVNDQRTRIEAPVSGQVAKRSVQPGARVAPGTPLLTVIPLDAVWVDANFKESQLRRIRVGQPVTLEADVYGSAVTYHGKVAGLSAGTGSAFSLLPAQNATGNWIKIVQRVPVRIALDAEELKKAPLRVGLSMRAEVDTHSQDGALVAGEQTAARQTTVFDELGKKADAYVQAHLNRELKGS